MESNTRCSYLASRLLFLFLHISSLIQCSDDVFDESLDAILHDRAFRVMIHRRPHTGALYNATLPPNLAGLKVSVVGLRSATLWRKGANFSNVAIPARTLPVPHVKRLLIVYHNLSNWSSSYYSLPGYSLATSVVGFSVYDATHLRSRNLSKIELNTMGNNISIRFPDSGLSSNWKTKCAYFGVTGEVQISDMRLPDVCHSRSQGHFSIVVPVKKKTQKIWPLLAGCMGLVLVALAGAGAGVAAVKLFMGKRTQEMEKEADAGECLQTYWIASTKMPLAEVTRTQPVLESTSLPNPKLSWYA
ncbi:uncharacterized protein LOC127265682 [Andrographis paniculata]|uniref:uncharacterized protein LOC127265682 n=1 Tax=Andrographis paniculata TaxID=175694 RepID=UPI0021E715A2|nr:uncharacterized protein LOC127265682 [Andrographis paniculata]